MEIKKLLYTMGELSEMFDVSPSLIRHWEQQFPIIKPQRNKKGNRLFTQRDVDNFRLIYHLVKERGMTLEGAKKSIQKSRSELTRDAELLERLQNVKAMLLEVREELKAGDDQDSLVVDTPIYDEPDCETVIVEESESEIVAPVQEPEIVEEPVIEEVDTVEESEEVEDLEPEAEDLESELICDDDEELICDDDEKLVCDEDEELIGDDDLSIEDSLEFTTEFEEDEEDFDPEIYVQHIEHEDNSIPMQDVDFENDIEEDMDSLEFEFEEVETSQSVVSADDQEFVSADQSGVPPVVRRVKRREKDDDHKELFAYFEQSLF